MRVQPQQVLAVAVFAGLIAFSGGLAPADQASASPQAKAATLNFGGTTHVHRWSAGPMGEWIKANGPSIEKTMMSWDRIPSLAALKPLPQSK